MIEKIIVKKKMTDKEISEREGEYFNQSHYDIIVNSNTDVYTENGDLLLKFRKKVLNKSLGTTTAELLRTAARRTHENRGASAGELNRDKMSNYIGQFVTPGKFRTKFKSSKTGILSKQATSNLSPSNIIGFFDKPDRNLKGKGAPCRLTAFNRDNPEVWKCVLPFIKLCDTQFKKLTPDKYKIQHTRAQEVPDFAIGDTSFSTVTINYSWRTALHRDIGDLVEGFGNLIVLKDPLNQNDYDGCYTGFPQYGVAVNVQHGDFLAMNVHEWHCNTEFTPLSEEIKGKWSKREKTNQWYFNRLSMVCYLREKMARCKNMKTNKIQLLKGGKSMDIMYRVVKKYKKPDSYAKFNTKLQSLHGILMKHVQNKKDTKCINSHLSNYYSYLVYYYKEFSNFFTIKDLKNLKKEFNISINTLNNLFTPTTTLILEKTKEFFKKEGTKQG